MSYSYPVQCLLNLSLMNLEVKASTLRSPLSHSLTGIMVLVESHTPSIGNGPEYIPSRTWPSLMDRTEIFIQLYPSLLPLIRVTLVFWSFTLHEKKLQRVLKFCGMVEKVQICKTSI
jgi:hypothetical protein